MVPVSQPLHPRPEVTGHRVHSVIGEGASSIVWSGADATGHPVAIKVPKVGPDEHGMARAELERHVLMAVRHPHLVPLRDVVPLADGRVALVFDLVRGESLAAMVHTRGHLRPGETVTAITPVCEAVAALHAAGGVHGDIAPRNVMVTADGRPLLLDLGAARVAGDSADDVFGTPGFIATEVRLGDAPGEASDVFALGALAWFCLTGNGAPDTDVRLDPETVQSHVGPELGPLIGRCIDPDPAVRPSSAEVARLFYDAAPPEPIEVVVGGDDASALTHRLRAAAAAERPESPAPSRRRWRGRPLTVVVGAATLAAVCGGSWAIVATAGGGVGSTQQGVAGVLDTPVATATIRPPTAASRASVTGSTRDSPTAFPTASTTASTTAPTSGRTTRVPTIGAGARPTVPDPTLGADAPRTRAGELIQALSDERAAALVARDEARLSAVHRIDSPAWRLDADVIRALRSRDVHWAGLALTVAHASAVSADGSRAVVRARVDWTAYTVVSPDGTQEPRPADLGQELDFALARGSAGWRIVEISGPPAT